MSEDQAAKVIQFPGKLKETVATSADVELPRGVALPPPLQEGPTKKANVSVGLAIVAVLMASVAVNRYAYRDQAAAGGSRAIASANLEIERDAAWEKSLAERLAQPNAAGDTARVGRKPTLVEQLRFATLEDKYVINFRHDGTSIATINVQKDGLVVDRAEFLRKYGQLFDGTFAAATLKSSDRTEGKLTESYELRDAAGVAKVRAFFEIDADQHLVAVRAVQI